MLLSVFRRVHPWMRLNENCQTWSLVRTSDLKSHTKAHALTMLHAPAASGRMDP